jgi:CBS domain-containing protein
MASFPEGPGIPESENTLEGLLVDGAISISRAMKQMDVTGQRSVFIVDGERRLLGVATDGDIRRWILSGRALEEPISSVMTTEPIVLLPGQTETEAQQLIVENQIEILPVLDETGRVSSFIRWVDLFDVPPRKHGTISAPVVIMAGGEGTRLAPFTKVLPKPLVPVGDKPIVELIMERFAGFGCTEFHLSVNYKANLIRAYFADIEHGFDLAFVQEDRPLGTAGSLALLRGRLTTSIATTRRAASGSLSWRR